MITDKKNSVTGGFSRVLVGFIAFLSIFGDTGV
jgi:hypothetical protein